MDTSCLVGSTHNIFFKRSVMQLEREDKDVPIMTEERDMLRLFRDILGIEDAASIRIVEDNALCPVITMTSTLHETMRKSCRSQRPSGGSWSRRRAVKRSTTKRDRTGSSRWDSMPRTARSLVPAVFDQSPLYSSRRSNSCLTTSTDIHSSHWNPSSPMGRCPATFNGTGKIECWSEQSPNKRPERKMSDSGELIQLSSKNFYETHVY